MIAHGIHVYFLLGIQLNVSVSLHNQGVLEQEQIILVPLDGSQFVVSQARSAPDKRKTSKGYSGSEVHKYSC